MGILVLAVTACLELMNLQGHTKVLEIIGKSVTLSAAAFFFVSYLLGVLVRLFAPDFVDRLSKNYLRIIRRNKEDWIKDVFPYKKSLTSYLTRNGMAKVPMLMTRLNSAFGKKNNTSFFNYCKWFIDANDTSLSRQVQQTEALVRFLSGTTLALLIAVPLNFVFLILFVIYKMPLFYIIYGGLLVMALMSLCLILERFKYQRGREVIMVWSCVYLIINGGSANMDAEKGEKLIESVFFPIDSISKVT